MTPKCVLIKVMWPLLNFWTMYILELHFNFYKIDYIIDKNANMHKLKRSCVFRC